MCDTSIIRCHVRFLLFGICGEPLAFLIEVNGHRICIHSGGIPTQLPPNERVGLAILRMALLDFHARLAAALAHLQPRYFLPIHQDDSCRPLSAGFHLRPLTDFHFVQGESAQQPRSRLILMDYFKPHGRWRKWEGRNPKKQIPNGGTTDYTDFTDESIRHLIMRAIRVVPGS